MIEDRDGVDLLQDAYRRYTDREMHPIGRMVMWKAGMATSDYPKEGQPCVVLQVEPGRKATAGTGHIEDGAPADVQLGMMINGTFLHYWYDSARFEKYRMSAGVDSHPVYSKDEPEKPINFADVWCVNTPETNNTTPGGIDDDIERQVREAFNVASETFKGEPSED